MAKETQVPLGEVLTRLRTAVDERELNDYQRKALNHAEQLSRITAEEAEAMRAELLELDFISPQVAARIVDIVPTHPDDVRVIFAKERFILEKNHIDSIIDIVGRHI